MSRSVGWRAALFACVVVAGWPSRGVAQDGIGVRFGFGYQAMTGDIADALDHAIDADFSLLVPVGSFRVGGGINWASFDVVDQDSSWSQVRLHLLGSYPFQLTPVVRPYVEARFLYNRLYPEDDRFFKSEDDEEEILRDAGRSGVGVEGVLGTQFLIRPHFAIDVAAALARFGVSPDLSDEGFGPIDSGGTWRIFVGVAWYPLHGSEER